MMPQKSRFASNRPAFTLVELLTVIGIITILIAILMPVLHRARETAWRTRCLSNIRQITTAWHAYALANDGLLVSANTGPGGWASAGNTDEDIKTGLLYPYVKTPEVYRCPSDFNLKNVRTYSINSFLNGEPFGRAALVRLTQINQPSHVFVAIEEYDPRGYNINSFGFDPSNSGQWVDVPAHLHGDGCTMSFADGRAEYWQFADPRTKTLQIGDPEVNSPDLRYLISMAGY